MTAAAAENDFATLAFIEDIARLTFADSGDDDAWRGLSVSWSRP